jgi:hypothetical protein
VPSGAFLGACSEPGHGVKRIANENAAIQGNGRWTKRRNAFPCESLQCRNYGLFLSTVKRHSLPLSWDSYLLGSDVEDYPCAVCASAGASAEHGAQDIEDQGDRPRLQSCNRAGKCNFHVPAATLKIAPPLPISIGLRAGSQTHCRGRRVGRAPATVELAEAQGPFASIRRLSTERAEPSEP